QVDKDRYLRLQNVRHDRRLDVIDRAELVSARAVVLVAERGHENDRNVLGAFALTNQRGGLKTVHAGHVDVEKNDGEFVVEQRPQRFAPGIGADYCLPEVLQHRLQRQEFLRLIVDDEDVDFAVVHSESYQLSAISVQLFRLTADR